MTNHLPIPPRRSAAFTLLEMLVAVAITALMILFVNTVLSSISASAGQGAQFSTIIQSSRTLSDQLQRDMGTLVGPGGDGFLVILQKRYAVTGNAATDTFLTADDRKRSLPTELRADQIAFIRSRGSLEPICPGNSTSYSNNSKASFVRVWYGHPRLVDSTGLVAPLLQEVDAVNWVLGRQVLFLDQSNITGSVHVDFATNWTVTGTSAGAPTEYYKGVSDVLDRTLADVVTSFNATGYTAEAGPYRFAFGKDRLWCAVEPGGYDSWQIAQMHPYFVPHVSSFQIDFAGDYSPRDGAMDIDAATNTVKWYTGIPSVSTDPSLTYAAPASAFTTASAGTTAIYETSPTNAPNADAAFIFKPRGSDWPMLLRFRFRLHDAQGKIAANDGTAGRVLEQIVRVTP
jgi:prepilin-type N-terminal cleavage/methylation domain-containing protein